MVVVCKREGAHGERRKGGRSARSWEGDNIRTSLIDIEANTFYGKYEIQQEEEEL